MAEIQGVGADFPALKVERVAATWNQESRIKNTAVQNRTDFPIRSLRPKSLAIRVRGFRFEVTPFLPAPAVQHQSTGDLVEPEMGSMVAF